MNSYGHRLSFGALLGTLALGAAAPAGLTFNRYAEDLVETENNILSIYSGDLDADGFSDPLIFVQTSEGIFATHELRSVTATSSTWTETVLETFSNSVSFSESVNDIIDANGDGYADIITLSSTLGFPSVGALLFDSGTGLYDQELGYGSFATASTVFTFANLDSDSFLELAASNGSSVVVVNPGSGGGSTSVIGSVSSPLEYSGIQVADIDNDGLLDVSTTVVQRVFGPFGVDHLTFAGYQWFQNPGDSSSWAGDSLTVASLRLDFDGDGDVDIVPNAATDLGSGSYVLDWDLYRSETTGFLSQSIPLDQNVESIRYVDLDNDGDLDVVGTDSGNTSIIIFERLDVNILSASTTVPVGTWIYEMEFPDSNQDSLTDVLVRTSVNSNDTVILYENAGSTAAVADWQAFN